MNIRQLHKNFVNIKRFQEIVGVLTKYGFTDLLDFLHIDLALGLAKKVGLVSKDYQFMPRAKRLKLAAEELGPTFVKLGQVLSTRDDILPPEYIEELEKLQEEVRPLSRNQVQELLCKFYDVKDIHEVFLEFNYEPIATASISQVHEARLNRGDRVIIKIQRPRIREMIETDLGVLSYIISLIQEQFGDPDDPANWSQVLEDFISHIVKELDFNREARLMQRFHNMLDKHEGVRVPSVYFEYSGRTILVQEFIGGHSLRQLQEIQDEEFNPNLVGERLIKSFFLQVFSEGVFHGDPHPGNIRIFPDNTLVFLDLGMVGQLDQETMMLLTRVFYGAGKGDFDLVARSFHKMCRGTVLGVSDTLVMELRDLILAYRSLSLSNIEIDQVLPAIDEILRRNRLRLPTQLSLLFKAMICLDRVVKNLHADLNLMDFLLPQVQEMIRAQFEVEQLSRTITDRSMLIWDYASEVPRDLFQILKNIQRNQNEQVHHYKRLDSWVYRTEMLLNRAILGLMISGLLVGSSFLLAFNEHGDSFQYILGVAGYLIAGIFAVTLIYFIASTSHPTKD